MMRITRNSKKTLIDRVMEKVLVTIMVIALVMGGIITAYLFSVKNKMEKWNYSVRLEMSTGNSTISCSNVHNEVHVSSFLDWAHKQPGFEHKEEDDITVIDCYTKEKDPQGFHYDLRVYQIEDSSYVIEDWSVPTWLRNMLGGPLRVRVPNGWYESRWENYIWVK